MIELDLVHQELARQPSYISTVELAIVLEANVSEVRQRLNELGDKVTKNEHDEWRALGDLVCGTERSPLTEAELQERDELENTVSQAFYIAGQALKTLRDKRLYRETHNRFEDYLSDRFGFTKRKAYYLIDAYEVVNNLKSEQFVHFLPTNESQCRELAKLPVPQQAPAWVSALEEVGRGKAPPARIIKQVVKEIKGVEPVFDQKKKDGPVLVAGIGVEYVAVLDEETYGMLKEYQERKGKATLNGAVRMLLDDEKSRGGENQG